MRAKFLARFFLKNDNKKNEKYINMYFTYEIFFDKIVKDGEKR